MQHEIARLDWRTLPLQGRVLIEASAGTGKTWNIGLVFLRLLLERQYPVERILVLTFTDAAAQELRERLRKRLVEAEHCLQLIGDGGAAEIDDAELAQWLQENYRGDGAKAALRRIQLARLGLDRAPIATIHALCQRILREYPLDAGSAFGADKLFDETELLRECVEDFWRRRYLGTTDHADEADIIAKGPEGLLFDLRDLLTRDARVLPLAESASPRARVLLDAFAFCRNEIPRRARQRGGQTYSMLIAGVHERVCASAAFADKLFEVFPAALIDEFQDTDRRQFAIFDRIYRDAHGTPRGLMAMIGDPKQAIYAFRGGDIAAYLYAREQAGARFALATNHRSSARLIEACNALYALSDGGFDDLRVRYQQVSAAGGVEDEPYAADGDPVAAPFVVHAFRGEAKNLKGEPLDSLAELEKLALDDCAARIVELLNDSSCSIGGRPVAPGDIAVLLPQNRQVAELRKRLVARGVPCVGSGRGSVFDTEVARELELVLYAVLNAEDERAVRGALATRLLGRRYADMLAWHDDAAAFEVELERFARWRTLAQSRGVLALLRDLLAQRGADLRALPDGERVLTDLRHLGEALAEQESGSGLDAVYAWFAAIRREGDDAEVDAAEARQLRIESDARRVQLMTLHAAKGLEFPLVFLPLAWRIADRKGNRAPKILHFHDDAGDACIDVGSSAFIANKAQHFREDLQERLRLLYVALTRAIHAVHVYWVDRRDAANPKEGWQIPAIDRLIRCAQRGLGVAECESSLAAMARQLPGVAVLGPCAHNDAKYDRVAPSVPTHGARAPLPAQRPFLWLHSFSSLSRGAYVDSAEAGAGDESDAPADADDGVVVEDPRLLALDVWRGRHFGNAVHALLEDAPSEPVTRDRVAMRFATLAVRPRAPEDGDPFAAAAQMLELTRTTDLGDGLRLADLPPAACVAEFEFQFPVGVSSRHLREVCTRHGHADVIPAQLSTSAVSGMLTGFADLIFEFGGRYHVLDYKTNRLGLSVSDYSSVALEVAMHTHHYPLQALLYTVALHRYLRTRLPAYTPQRNLGGSWYLFLRGVGLQPGAGVWRRQWPSELIEALDAAFAGIGAPA